MRRLVSLTLLAIVCCCMQAQKQARILVDIKGLTDKDTLTVQWGANNKSMNPNIMQRGAVEDTILSVPLNEPRLVVLGVKGKGVSYEILASPNEEITVTGRLRKIEAIYNIRYQLQKIRVSGAQYQEEYEKIISTYQHHQDSIDNKVYREYKDVAKLIELAKKNNDEQAIADMYKTIHGQSYIERVMSTFQEHEDYMKQTVSANRETFLGPLLLLKLAGRLNKQYKPLYDEMSDAAKQCYYGREVKDEVDPPTLIGSIAPTVMVNDTTDTERMLSFSGKGYKYLLIDFWASWCQPCHKELPNLNRIYTKFHDKGLDIIGISADQNAADWKECLEEIESPWPNYLDAKRQAISEYKVQYIPSIFIVDSEGNIIAEKLRGKELSDYVEKLFEESGN